jgi:hypothetical protein
MTGKSGISGVTGVTGSGIHTVMEARSVAATEMQNINIGYKGYIVAWGNNQYHQLGLTVSISMLSLCHALSSWFAFQVGMSRVTFSWPLIRSLSLSFSLSLSLPLSPFLPLSLTHFILVFISLFLFLFLPLLFLWPSRDRKCQLVIATSRKRDRSSCR